MNNANAVSNYIPMKINPSGVMAPIFANALLAVPLTVLQLFFSNNSSDWAAFFANLFSNGHPFYIFPDIFPGKASSLFFEELIKKTTIEEIRIFL